MLTSVRSALILALLAVTARSSAAVSANCTAQTLLLTSNDNIALQVDAINADASNQVKKCIQDKNSNCEVKMDYTSYKTACEVEGGKVYEPTASFQCKDGLYTTTINQKYITCVGDSCNTDEFSDAVDANLENYTSAVGVILATDGIECKASFSGAMSSFGFAASMVIGLGSMVIAALF